MKKHCGELDEYPLAVRYGWRACNRTEPLYMYPPAALDLKRARVTAFDPDDLPSYVRSEVNEKYLTEWEKKLC